MIFEIVHTIAILQVGLTAGLLFIFSIAVNPGLARLSEEEYYRAMKLINQVIINPIFLLVFIGPTITMPLLTYMSRNDSNMFIFTLITTIVYFLGVILITIFKNVPLNNKLEKLNSEQFRDVFLWYKKPWNFWHNIRTFFGITSFLILSANMVF
ncbi:MAG: DUF1772 domain-containing protein [Dehalococcoidia bacterium]|tara:strand:+ start:2101 stop:2562 length:462 start_codon:yes stop_codon:yes gene_type:complete